MQALLSAAAILLPLVGTAVGAAAVFLPSLCLPRGSAEGFAAGVMTAAGFFSLLLPAIEQGGRLPAVGGFFLGAAAMVLLTVLFPQPEDASAQRTRLLFLSVTLHNIPEGMAVGVAVAAARHGCASAAAVLALSAGIAVQNIPEGCIIAAPLRLRGFSRGRAALGGLLSGAVEPPAALAALLLTASLTPLLPYVLSFAAGAMWAVTAGELLPESRGTRGLLASILGFSLMMWLDLALS